MARLVTEARPILWVAILGGFISGVGLAVLGGVLVYIGSSGETQFEFFGQSFQSTNIGIASIFIGGTLIVLLVRRTLSSLDRAVAQDASSSSASPVSTDYEGVPTPIGRTADDRDCERIRCYQQLFDRPAFIFPCIFEGALLEIKAAVDSVSAAIATGTLYSRGGELLGKLPARTDFETEPYRKTLDEIRNSLSGLKRTIDELIDLLEDAEGKKANQSPKGFFHHMEFLLCDLIRLGISQSFVQKSFALMDRIDTERNYILTTSTEQLQVSKEIARKEGKPRWDLFYLRTHTILIKFLKTGRYNVKDW
jgi:hypothetical protein